MIYSSWSPGEEHNGVFAYRDHLRRRSGLIFLWQYGRAAIAMAKRSFGDALLLFKTASMYSSGVSSCDSADRRPAVSRPAPAFLARLKFATAFFLSRLYFTFILSSWKLQPAISGSAAAGSSRFAN